jgi:hypothetical protein
MAGGSGNGAYDTAEPSELLAEPLELLLSIGPPERVLCGAMAGRGGATKGTAESAELMPETLLPESLLLPE